MAKAVRVRVSPTAPNFREQNQERVVKSRHTDCAFATLLPINSRFLVTTMLENYFPILLFILVGLAVGGGAMACGWLLAPNRPDRDRKSTRLNSSHT